jgi:DNA-binding FadR family transcriptional regulator
MEHAQAPAAEAPHPYPETGTAGMVDSALRDLLQAPEMEPGRKLPTERALAAQLGVPRSAVRSALGRLEARGMVRRVMGSGTYVSDPSPSPDAEDHRQDASPLEIMETRLLIEPKLAGLIVAHANNSDLEQIRTALCGGAATTDFAEFEVWDARFHQALAEATKNRLMIEIYRTITVSRHLTEWGEMKRRSITEERRQIYNSEHRAILDALQARDAGSAEAALRTHLLSVKSNLFGF